MGLLAERLLDGIDQSEPAIEISDMEHTID
jgi:hypothetical protein